MMTTRVATAMLKTAETAEQLHGSVRSSCCMQRAVTTEVFLTENKYVLYG